MMTIHERIESITKSIYPKLIKLRRHFHQHPELSYKEFETTERIIAELTALGYEIERPLETGCVAVLDGNVASDRIIALRADIDALPIHEEGEHKAGFTSKTPGVAHCCGHDVHLTNLLGVAHVLAELRDEIPGKVVLVFQPGEEKPPGGGKLIMDSGVLQRLGVQAIYGLHTYPYGIPGEVSVIKGPMMARPDEFTIKVIGKGGHAAIPQKAVDPIVIAAQIVTVIQSIVSRSVNPLEPAVVTIGKISGGSAHNIIPDSVTMLGTIRTFSEELTMKISRQIEEVSRALAQSAGAQIEYTLVEGYPAVINTPEAVDAIVNAAARLPEVSVVNLPEPIMAGEDFAFYLQEIPGSYMYLGSGSEESASNVYNWHHPKYNADERAMYTGVSLLAALVFEPESIPKK